MVQAVVQKVGGGVALAPEKTIETRFWRFSLADFSRHGGWMIPRLTTALDMHELHVAGWLRSLLESKEYLFLCQDHGVALAELTYSGGIANKAAVRERFVLAESEKYQREASGFYDEFARWAKTLGADMLIVEEQTDVPHDLIKERLGRLFTRQQVFARL